MLHVTIIILVCFTVSAPSEGIAVTRRKNYLFDGFCLFEENVPKATEISSSSIDNVDEKQFLDCVKHKITYRLSFFNNSFINQYQNRKDNYCSIMNSVLDTKKKESSSSVELTYRKRNLLWTRKGVESLKTLKPTKESITTTPKPLEHHTLNYAEKKRFFAIKKTKTQKRKRVRRHTHGRYSDGKSKNLRKQITFSEPAHQLSEVIWDNYFKEKPRRSGQAFPSFHYLEKFIGFKKNSRNHDSDLKQILRGRESAAGEATHISLRPPKFRHSHSYVSNIHRKNGRLFDVKNSNKENRLLSSNFNGMDNFFLPLHVNDHFIQGQKSKKFRRRLGRLQSQVKSLPLRKNFVSILNQFIYDPKFKGNDGINTGNHNELSLATDFIDSNEYENIEEAQHSNKQEKRNECDKNLDRSESNPDTKSVVPEYGTSEKQFKTIQEMGDFVREILKASADYSAVLNEDFNSAEEPNEFCSPESTITKSFLSHRKSKKEIPITDFDFPDYDEIYDTAADRSLKKHTPFYFLDRRKFKFRRKVFPKKKYSKIHQEPRSDSSCQTPLNFKRSLLLKKLERKKKFCGSRCSKSCGTPHRCWRSAPLLCIPYIRKSQDDLLKYLIRVMQNMLGKPYPQKLDIFENTKYKPSVKKCSHSTCEDIIPHDPEDEDDDEDDNSDSKSPCEPYSRQYSSTPAPCPPSACSPVPTTCSSCPKGCPKNSNDASGPSFPCSLPNLNQIYTEPSPCPSDKCYSTLPPFLLPLSSIIQSVSKNDLSKKPDFASASMKPTASTVKSLVSISNTNGKVLNDSESLTFFPPKKLSLGFFKKAKEVNSDLLADNNQLHSDQRLNDKIFPEFVDYQEEMKLLNLTDNMSESTLKPSTNNEPFLFELPKFFGDEKHATDLSNFNINNSFARRDLNVIHEYDDEVFRLKNPTNVSPETATQIIHQIPSKQNHIGRKIYYKPLPANEDNTYQSFPMIVPKVYDGPQIEKPLNLKHKSRKYFKFKNRKSLKRHKRENYYDVDDFINYDGYLYDTKGNNENYEEPSFQQLKKKPNSDLNRLVDDYSWTPMQFEMFDELAKLVTETKVDDISSPEPVSVTPKPSATNLAEELSSTMGNQLGTNSVALTTEKSSTSALPKEVSTIKTTSSAETQEYDTTSGFKQTKRDNKTRFNMRSSSTVEFQEVHSEKPEKPIEPLDVNTYIDTTEDGQVLTTVGSAFIVKGPKKQMTKPSPKMYTRVYPDSVPIESGKNETTITITTDSASRRNILLRTTPAMISVTPDVKLQLLAVCEGYLEVVKVMKSQNQSFAGDLDSDLSSYCENIISQSLSQQTESPKFKKEELNSSATAGNETLQNTSKKVGNLMPESKLHSSSKLADAVLKRELDNKKLEVEKVLNTNAERSENTESPLRKKKQNVKKSKRKKKEYQHGNQKISEVDDEFLKKGMTKEQVELLRLLKKRKRALLNWLFNSKEDQVQPEIEETEYFDDNDESNGNSLNLGNSSGTVKPRGAKSSGKTKKADDVITNDPVIPVYAKEYGYDKGGQLRQVEVLWRKVNDQTNEKQTYKNLSVLALVLTSTVAPNIFKRNNNFSDINGYVNEDVSETPTKKENKAAEEFKRSNNNSEVQKKEENAKTTSLSNTTVTSIRKPNPSYIIATEMTTNTTKHPNITRKIAGKLNKAKGIVEEYTIEFWNYAVYILPIMFSILFLFCCACCAIHILRTKKKGKKKKKKKKQFQSTDEEASSEETDSEPKKRRDKSKKSKNIWKVWKKNANDEAILPEKNKSFLKFLKSKKNDKTGEDSLTPYSALPEASVKADNQSEAAERRELIALLEELKKIEMEQVGQKKEQKSVQVQYMIQDHEESVFKRPEMAKDNPFCTKNCRFHEPVAEEFGIYRDGELSELLPCECGYYSKKRDYLRNYGFRGNEEGRCERLFNLFRKTHHQLEKKKKITEKDRNFIFDKYRNAVISDEKDETGFTIKVCDMSEFNLPAGNPNDWVGEMERFNNPVMKKKHVRLKDDGVLCKL